MFQYTSRKHYSIITFFIIVFCIINLNYFGQRPITDSLITKMISEMQNGNSDIALALADSGFKYSQIEEPLNKDEWRAHFGLRKAQILLQIKGDIEEGEKLLSQLKIEEEEHNEEALYWWLQLINVKGVLYEDLGDFEMAKDMYDLAYKSGLKDHVYDSKTNYYFFLSELFFGSGQLDSANYYSQKLISIQKLQGDSLSSFYYSSLTMRAMILVEQGKYDEATIIINFVKVKYYLFQNKKNHSTRMRFFSRMSFIKTQTKNYKSALKYARESEQIFLKSRGKNNYEYYKYLNQVGFCHYLMNQRDSAYFLLKSIPKLFEQNTLNKTHLLSIRGKEIFINQNKDLRNNLSFMLEYFDNKYSDYNESLYDYILFQKRSTSQSFEKLKKYYKNRSNDIWKRNFFSWKENRSNYFIWLTTHNAKEDSSKNLAYALESQEKDLFKQAGLEYLSNQKKINWKNLSDKLTNNSVAIEFVRYSHLKTKQKIYGALIVSLEYKSPVFVKLCKESDLSDLLKYKFAETDYEYTQRVYQSNALYNLIWKPLESHLKTTNNCYISLSGLLYKIALDATFTKDSPIHPNIHLLHSTAALVEKVPLLPESPKAILYGGITYNLNKAETIDSLSKNSVSKNVHFYHRGTNGNDWAYLKGTEKEVNEINTLLKKGGCQVQLNLGAACSENSLKAKLKESPPNILHIATHGYYPVMQDSVLSYTQTASYARSGLVMAGANTSRAYNSPIKGFGDGILTAPEITALDLSNTQLVVLSACESGKGKISHVDEVYGLQRAFKITGAHYVIYTLWKIPDEPTKEFMVYFYKRLSEGSTIENAFFQTKEHMKKSHPIYHWAGFQLIK